MEPPTGLEGSVRSCAQSPGRADVKVCCQDLNNLRSPAGNGAQNLKKPNDFKGSKNGYTESYTRRVGLLRPLHRSHDRDLLVGVRHPHVGDQGRLRGLARRSVVTLFDIAAGIAAATMLVALSVSIANLIEARHERKK